MILIKVNVFELEKITNNLIKITSDTDELLNRLKSISSEMQNDVELSTYIQSKKLIDSVLVATDAINRGNDIAQTLKNVMLSVASDYKETEKMNIDALNRMIIVMDAVSSRYNASVTSYNIPHIEHTDLLASQNKVQQLVTDNAEEMQITNIAVITKVVQEEYEVKSVKDMDT